MVHKTNKVQYACTKAKNSKGALKRVPKILLSGIWLQNLGFSHQDNIEITGTDGAIQIRKVQ